MKEARRKESNTVWFHLYKIEDHKLNLWWEILAMVPMRAEMGKRHDKMFQAIRNALNHDWCLYFMSVCIVKNSSGGSRVKNPPANAGDTGKGVWSLGQEDPLEKEMATHSSILAGKFHAQRSPRGYSPWSWKELDTTEHTFPLFPPFNCTLKICAVPLCKHLSNKKNWEKLCRIF